MLSLVKPRRRDAYEFALANREILGYLADSLPVDIGIGGFDYELRVIDRSRRVEYAEDVWLRVCGPEDLIVLKVFAGRDQDWVDVQGITIRQGQHLDWTSIETELGPLLDAVEAPERLDRLQRMRRR